MHKRTIFQFCGVAAATIAVGLCGGDRAAVAQNAPAPAFEFTAELNSSVASGLAWLAGDQNEDGSWDGNSKGAATALAVLAFMADGQVPGRGGYGEVIQKGVDYLVSIAAETGLLASGDAGPMYTHGFVTLCLGEVYGMTGQHPDSKKARALHDALVKSVALLAQCQNDQGGWRYSPVPTDADLSVTICQIMGLRAARNAGIEVPKETIDRAIEYVKKSQNGDGSFAYVLGSGGGSPALVGAGVASLYYAGIHEGDAIERGVKQLKKKNKAKSVTSGSHLSYTFYYTTQAVFLAGKDLWDEYWPEFRDIMISKQASNGSWSDPEGGNAYATAMALISLQIPKRYLPIFQK